MTAAALIRAILAHTKWTQSELAYELDVKQPTVSRLLGNSEPRRDLWERILALASRVGVQGFSEIIAPIQNVFPVVGYVGLGEDVTLMDGIAEQPLEEIELPFGFAENGCKALIAKGHSQHPRVRNGEVIVFRRVETAPEEHLGEEMIVGIKGGTVLLKTLRRGSEKGLFSLESHNAPLRENERVEWLAEVVSIVPAKHWRYARIKTASQAEA